MSENDAREASKKEVFRNNEAYQCLKAELEEKHMGHFALMHDGGLIDVYDDSNEAYSVGCKKFGLGKFSIQAIGEEPISLGIFTLFPSLTLQTPAAIKGRGRYIRLLLIPAPKRRLSHQAQPARSA